MPLLSAQRQDKRWRIKGIKNRPHNGPSTNTWVFSHRQASTQAMQKAFSRISEYGILETAKAIEMAQQAQEIGKSDFGRIRKLEIWNAAVGRESFGQDWKMQNFGKASTGSRF